MDMRELPNAIAVDSAHEERGDSMSEPTEQELRAEIEKCEAVMTWHFEAIERNARLYREAKSAHLGFTRQLNTLLEAKAKETAQHG